MPASSLSITLIGAGKMGFALLKRWLQSAAFSSSRFQILEPAPGAELKELNSDILSINPTAEEIHASDVVVVAVKPQILNEVMDHIKRSCHSTTLVVSVAAGKTIEEFESAFGTDQPIVRAMPNTPATIGRGITALYANKAVIGSAKKTAQELLSAVGEVVWLDNESDMDAVTALSGSGPAYVFHLAECMAQAGIEQGLSAELARKLADATVSGAGALIHQSTDSPTTLRENVTSPGGTTAAALSVLMEQEALKSLMVKAIDAATKRGKELGK